MFYTFSIISVLGLCTCIPQVYGIRAAIEMEEKLCVNPLAINLTSAHSALQKKIEWTKEGLCVYSQSFQKPTCHLTGPRA